MLKECFEKGYTIILIDRYGEWKMKPQDFKNMEEEKDFFFVEKVNQIAFFCILTEEEWFDKWERWG